jgi:hypothetical protein
MSRRLPPSTAVFPWRAYFSMNSVATWGETKRPKASRMRSRSCSPPAIALMPAATRDSSSGRLVAAWGWKSPSPTRRTASSSCSESRRTLRP